VYAGNFHLGIFSRNGEVRRRRPDVTVILLEQYTQNGNESVERKRGGAEQTPWDLYSPK
jgi:hypothetical protein